MTLDEAFQQLGTTEERIPVEAMEVVLDEWGAAGPRGRALLHAFVQGRDLSEHTARMLFPIVHMLGEKEETAAFADICALAADPERGDLVLGDALSETLPRILVSCFGGDTQPLRTLIEQADADEYARSGALLAMAYLAKTGRVPRDEMHAYLAGLFGTLQPQDENVVWFGWVTAAGLLGFATLSDEAQQIFDREFVPLENMDMDEFKDDLKHVQVDPMTLGPFEALGVGPVGDSIDLLAGWYDDADRDEFEDEPLPETPYVNPLRNVGRNDPCPCGSGKKFKKCCLDA